MFLFVVVLNGEKALSKGGSLITWQVATSFPCPAGVCFLHQVAPTSKSRSTARETPLIITTREKKGCFSWFVVAGRNRHLFSHVTNFSFYHPGAGDQPNCGGSKRTFNSLGGRSTLKLDASGSVDAFKAILSHLRQRRLSEQ